MNHSPDGMVAEAPVERMSDDTRAAVVLPVVRPSLIGSVARSLPTLLTLAALGFVGWWGHRHEWKMPKFSNLTGQVEPPDDWCAAHGVPDSICVECKEARLPRLASRGWCDLHEVAECPLCHPELAQLSKPPAVSAADLDRAKRALDFGKRPTSNPVCDTHRRRIQFTDAATVDKAGVGVEPTGTGPVSEHVSAPGEIVFDESRLARLSSRAPGTVWRVFRQPGDVVKAGDLLALVDAGEVGKTKAELLQAAALLELRTQTAAGVRSSGAAVAEVRLREAEAAVKESAIRLEAARQALVNMGLPLAEADTQVSSADSLRRRIQFLGIPAKELAGIDPASATSNLLPVVSPSEGQIVSRAVVTGEAVDTSRVLFEVADTTRWWLTLDARAEDARKLRIGQKVSFRPDSGEGELAGRLSWIGARADPKTRTVRVRADLADPEGRHRANTFGSGRVILREEASVVVVPPDAVQWDGCCHVVFVRDRDYLKPGAPKVFHVRKVRIGARDEKGVEIPAGLLVGEVIVTRGGGLLLTELLRANLGEGCACCHVK